MRRPRGRLGGEPHELRVHSYQYLVRSLTSRIGGEVQLLEYLNTRFL